MGVATEQKTHSPVLQHLKQIRPDGCYAHTVQLGHAGGGGGGGILARALVLIPVFDLTTVLVLVVEVVVIGGGLFLTGS